MTPLRDIRCGCFLCIAAGVALTWWLLWPESGDFILAAIAGAHTLGGGIVAAWIAERIGMGQAESDVCPTPARQPPAAGSPADA